MLSVFKNRTVPKISPKGDKYYIPPTHLTATYFKRPNRRPIPNTVKPLLSGHLQDLPYPSVHLIEVCKNCAMFVIDLHSTLILLCTVIKFHVVKEAVLYFGQDF